jgi:hypothetical protein
MSSAINLVVRHKGEVVEVFKNLSMDETAPNHVEIAVNERSDYITLEDLGTASGLPADRPVIGVFDLSGGDDGGTGSDDADYSGDPSQHTGFYAFDEIDALNLIMVPGVTTAEAIHAGVTYAENRQDLMLLAETPIHLEPLEAVDFRKGQGMYSHGAFNSSYAALYYPWIEINNPVTGKRKLIPPSGAVAGCYARSDKKAHVWYAPAGIDRGRIFNALSLGCATCLLLTDPATPPLRVTYDVNGLGILPFSVFRVALFNSPVACRLSLLVLGKFFDRHADFRIMYASLV